MKLRTRFMLLLGLISVAVSVLIGITVYYNLNTSFNRFVASSQSLRVEQWKDIFLQYYAEKGSWKGIEELLPGQVGKASPRMGMPGGMGNHGVYWDRMVITDRANVIVADTEKENIGFSFTPDRAFLSASLEFQGQPIGMLWYRETQRGGMVALERQFTQAVNRSIVWSGILAVVIALIVGAIWAGKVTRPLEQMKLASRKISEGDLDQKVEVGSRDEIGLLAESFNTMAATLKRNEFLRKSLVADTAHELRTPLSILRGKLEAMLNGENEPSAQNIAFIHDEAVRISYLVNDLQNLSLAEAGRLPLHMEAVDIRELIRKIASAFSLEAENKQIELSLQLPDELPLIQADPLRLEQVLVNLLANALRYTPTKGRIEITVVSDGKSLSIAIRDSGTGIAEEEIPFVFERFYRGDKARSRSDGGSGLGLSIAKSFVELHGGKMHVESRIGEGSEFVIEFPVLPQQSTT